MAFMNDPSRPKDFDTTRRRESDRVLDAMQDDIKRIGLKVDYSAECVAKLAEKVDNVDKNVDKVEKKLDKHIDDEMKYHEKGAIYFQKTEDHTDKIKSLDKEVTALKETSGLAKGAVVTIDKISIVVATIISGGLAFFLGKLFGG